MELAILKRKFERNLTNVGWWRTIKKSVAYILQPLYVRRVYRLYRINLATAPEPDCPNPSEFQFILLTAEDTDVIEQIEWHSEWLRGRVSKKLANGQICLVALDGRRLAGFNLIGFGEVEIPLIETCRFFRPGTAWSEHIAVIESYRRRGLGSELRYRIFRELKHRGVRYLYGGTLRSNEPSLKLARRVGFTEYADVTYNRILRFQRWRCRRVHR